MIVVDASIAAKWYLNEPGSEEAAVFLTSDSVLMAPALIRLEVNGAIIRRYREGKLSLKRAKEACELWEADLAGGALRLIADETLYLAASVDLGRIRLVTADPTFHARAAKAFPFVDLQAASQPQ